MTITCECIGCRRPSELNMAGRFVCLTCYNKQANLEFRKRWTWQDRYWRMVLLAPGGALLLLAALIFWWAHS